MAGVGFLSELWDSMPITEASPNLDNLIQWCSGAPTGSHRKNSSKIPVLGLLRSAQRQHCPIP